MRARNSPLGPGFGVFPGGNVPFSLGSSCAGLAPSSAPSPGVSLEFLPPHSHWDPGLFLGESRGIQGYSWGIPRNSQSSQCPSVPQVPRGVRGETSLPDIPVGPFPNPWEFPLDPAPPCLIQPGADPKNPGGSLTSLCGVCSGKPQSGLGCSGAFFGGVLGLFWGVFWGVLGWCLEYFGLFWAVFGTITPVTLLLFPRNLCQMQEDNSGFSLLLDLLSELYQKQPKIGYHLLYYLRAR